VSLCVLGAATAYLLARSTQREDVCAALSRFEQKHSIKFPTVDFVDDFQKLRQRVWMSDATNDAPDRPRLRDRQGSV
jgi:hypothetical protein